MGFDILVWFIIIKLNCFQTFYDSKKVLFMWPILLHFWFWDNITSKVSTVTEIICWNLLRQADGWFHLSSLTSLCSYYCYGICEFGLPSPYTPPLLFGRVNWFELNSPYTNRCIILFGIRLSLKKNFENQFFMFRWVRWTLKYIASWYVS